MEIEPEKKSDLLFFSKEESKEKGKKGAKGNSGDSGEKMVIGQGKGDMRASELVLNCFYIYGVLPAFDSFV